jgi:hypothetical protein
LPDALAALAAAVAGLLTESSLTLPDLAELTERQLFGLYYHPRDREGKPVQQAGQWPDADEVTSEEQAARIHFAAGAAFGIGREELERVWLEKHASIPEGV